MFLQPGAVSVPGDEDTPLVCYSKIGRVSLVHAPVALLFTAFVGCPFFRARCGVTGIVG